MSEWERWLGPGRVVALVLMLYLGRTLWQAGGDPLALARLGDGFRDGQPVGQEGYDGQFAYHIALDPRPEQVIQHLDVPAYRYQRILYPLAARLLALGQPSLIPWALIVVNLLAQAAGTALVGQVLRANGVSRWYALVYGLWAGLLLAARLDLTEPLCYAWVAAAACLHRGGRRSWAAACLVLAAFTKETALLFLAAYALADGRDAWRTGGRRWRALAGAWLPYGAGLSAFALFQLQLWRWFGTWGLASGGYMATPFEPLPFMGLWRVGQVSLPALGLYLAIFGPLIILPALAGLAAALWRLARGDWAAPVLALAANAGLVPFVPFSTFREPLGLVRLAAGLVLAVLLFGAHTGSRRTLNYSLAWLAALALLRE